MYKLLLIVFCIQSHVTYGVTELFSSVNSLEQLLSDPEIEPPDIPEDFLHTINGYRDILSLKISLLNLKPVDELNGEEALEDRLDILESARRFHRLLDIGFYYAWLALSSKTVDHPFRRQILDFPHKDILEFVIGLKGKFPLLIDNEIKSKFQQAIGGAVSSEYPYSKFGRLIAPDPTISIGRLFEKHRVDFPNNPQPKVLVLTTTHGGHQFVSEALLNMLQQRGDVKAEMIDVEALIKPGDSIYQSTYGESSYFDIYYEAFSQEKPWVFKELFERRKFLVHRYTPNELAYFEEFVKQGDYDLIISTCQHLPYLARMSFVMGIPYWLFGTDIKTDWDDDIQDYQNLLKSDTLNRGVPALKVFRHISNERNEIKREFDSDLSGHSLIKSSIPVRPNFYEPLSNSATKKLYDKLGVEPKKIGEENVVLVSMGSFSHKLLNDLTKEILESDQSLRKTRIIIIDRLSSEQWRQDVFQKTDGSVIVVEHLNSEEIATAMKLSRFIVSKPGGSTSAEIYALKAYLLAMFSQMTMSYEIENYDMLQRNGLANVMLDVKDLLRIFKLAESDNGFMTPNGTQNPEVPDWRIVFDKEFENFLSKYRAD